MTVSAVRHALRKHADPRRARKARTYFKTGRGEYGEGDVFIGVAMPAARALARDYMLLARSEILELLHSKVHDERGLALVILVEQFKRASDHDREAIYNLYLLNTRHVNNWDLVDISAPKIVGEYHHGLIRANKARSLSTVPAIFLKLARSRNMWERRMAMLSTQAFIRRGQSAQALRIADMLRHDTEDLIHKAVGWMLREVGERCSRAVLESYLKPRYKRMPRTMLRYAIEKLPQVRRLRYLRGLV